ncbi:flagellar biosynthetic protein FliO [Bacillus sp. 2205SS5-2]|uniref:flagellar biosynthetic protein FliO n=1 Tax=Bacillus sp. 2205SS5-2 TaxID=3109031 RepID=UPI0030060BED
MLTIKYIHRIVIAILIASFIGWGTPHPQAYVNPTVDDCFLNPNAEGCKEDLIDSDPTPVDNEIVAGPGVSVWDFIKMIFALIFVVGLIYLLLRFINQRSRAFQQTKLIHNLGGTPLGGNRSVQLVKVGERILVVGVGEDITLLKEIDNQGEYQEIINSFQQTQDTVLQANNPITKFLTKGQWKKREEESESSFGSLMSSQLAEMKKGRKNMLNELNKEEKKQDE